MREGIGKSLLQTIHAETRLKIYACMYTNIVLANWLEAASAVRLVRPWPDHFSAGRWSRSQTASPRVAKYTCVYDVHAAASDTTHSAACSSSASQSSPTRRPIAETPHQPLSFPFPKRP